MGVSVSSRVRVSSGVGSLESGISVRACGQGFESGVHSGGWGLRVNSRVRGSD